MIMKTARFPLGLKFDLKRPNQQVRECEIVDIYTTTDSKGEIVKIEYKIAYAYINQVMTQLVPDATIAKCLDKEGRLEEFLRN
jgi:hypothetical protein